MTAQRMARWAQLQAGDITLDSPFLSPDWARTLERVQRQTSRQIRVAVAVQDGRDVAFLAVRVGHLTAMPVGAPMCDYQGLVAEPGVKIDVRRMVQALGVQRYDFCHMIEAQTAFAPFARGRQLSHVVVVEGGYDAYEAARREAGTSVL